MPDVVLIRPGCTDFDDQNRIQGSLDLPLNRRGQEQVECLVSRLREVPFDVIFSASCEPARSTAIAICEECRVTFKELDEFRNLNHGLWQGLQVDDVRRKYPKVFKQWQESPETVCLPEGEMLAEAVERIQKALKKSLKRKRTIGIVASEPLATMIACVLRHERPELPESKCGEHPELRIEFFQIPTDDVKRIGEVFEAAVNRPTAPNGRQKNGSPKNGSPGNGSAGNGTPGSNGTDGKLSRNNGTAGDHSSTLGSESKRRGTADSSESAEQRGRPE